MTRSACAALAVALTLLGCAPAFEETPPSVEGFCEMSPCREPLRVRLKQAGDGYFDRTYRRLPPVVQPAFISVYAGETLYIEAEEGEEGPVNLLHVRENRNPDRTIEIQLAQDRDLGDGLSMLLVVRNPFPRPLRYNLSMMPLDREEMYRTSSCPVVPRGTASETWPFPVFVVAMAELRFLGPEGPFRCEK